MAGVKRLFMHLDQENELTRQDQRRRRAFRASVLNHKRRRRDMVEVVRQESESGAVESGAA